MRRAFLLILVVVPLGACGGSAPGCVALIYSGKSGTCNANEGKARFTVIPKESTAQLKGQSPDTFSYSADVTAIRLRASFSSFGDHARAEGRYVVVTLKVTNTSNGPAKWGASDQTRLLVGASPVREASRAEEDDPYSMTSQFSLYAIQPGQTRVGDVIFDVSPSKLASSVGRSAMPSALVLVAIGDQVEGAKSGVIVVLGR